jgi:hypothetical protein
MVKRINCLGIALVCVVTCFSFLYIQQPVGATGDLGNQPPGGYTEGIETLIIANSSTTTTIFEPGETIYISIRSESVDLAGNGVSENKMFITDINGMPMPAEGQFTQYSWTSPFQYGAYISAPTTSDHYLLNALIKDKNNNEFTARDVILVSGGAGPQKHIKTFSDPAYSALDWTYKSFETIYIEVYSGNIPNPAQSAVKFADYEGGESVKKIGDLSQGTITMNGDYARFQYNISLDLNEADLTNNALDVGYWYTISVDLLSVGGEILARNWSIQIQIVDVVYVEPSLSVSGGATQADPSNVEREGSQTTTISTEFEDTDNPAPDTFNITFKVRDPNGKDMIIVDGKKNGQSGEYGGTLSVIAIGGGLYSASYDLDPDNSFDAGNYDLYFMVEDGTGETAEDEYHNNNNELRISSSTSAPQVAIFSTECEPFTVDRTGAQFTTISAQFSDSDSLSIDDFSVLFKIRDPDDIEIILVNNKSHGQSGEFGGSLSITSSGSGEYEASYTFDPDGSFQPGYYDLFFEVSDEFGNSDDDGFSLNRNGLSIISSTAEPTVEPGTTQVNPSTVDKIAGEHTSILAQFEDIDTGSILHFTVTFKVRDEEGNEYIIVDSKKHGEPGEYGGTVTFASFGPNAYNVSYSWSPPLSMPNGNYSIYFKVEDEHGNFAEDDFGDNTNELTIKGEKYNGQGDLPLWFWLFLILIVIIVFMIVIFLFRGNKKEASYMPPQATSDITPPSYSYDNLTPIPPSVPPQQYNENIPSESPPPPQDYESMPPPNALPAQDEGNVQSQLPPQSQEDDASHQQSHPSAQDKGDRKSPSKASSDSE